MIDSSLGYFINPLVNVLLGYTVLHERLRRLQWVALALAASGVLWLTVHAGQLPWIALALAGSFGLYGLLRKIATLGPLEGLTLETLLLAPLALLAMAFWWHQGSNVFPAPDASLNALLMATGPLTAIPLLLFAAGARSVSLTTLGLLQYIGPTIQLVLGVWLFNEPFGGARLAGFVLIWLALAIYSAESWWFEQRGPLRPRAEASVGQPRPSRSRRQVAQPAGRVHQVVQHVEVARVGNALAHRHHLRPPAC